jgi:hypothetical protein
MMSRRKRLGMSGIPLYTLVALALLMSGSPLIGDTVLLQATDHGQRGVPGLGS